MFVGNDMRRRSGDSRSSGRNGVNGANRITANVLSEVRSVFVVTFNIFRVILSISAFVLSILSCVFKCFQVLSSVFRFVKTFSVLLIADASGEVAVWCFCCCDAESLRSFFYERTAPTRERSIAQLIRCRTRCQRRCQWLTTYLTSGKVSRDPTIGRIAPSCALFAVRTIATA